MKTRIFLFELRKALVSALAVSAACVLILFVTERAVLVSRGGGEDATLNQVINALLLAFIPVFAFYCGARGFSLEFREKQALFLSSLPLRRGWVWLLILGANLGAALIAVFLIFSFRPSLVGTIADEARIVFLGSLATGFLFAAGSCFAIVLRRALSVYLVGFAWCALAAWEIGALTSGPFGSLRPQVRFGGLWGGDLFCQSAWFLLLTLGFLVLSASCFIAGEWDLLRSKIRNGSLIVLLTVTSWMVIWGLHHTTLPTVVEPGTSESFYLSGTGTHLAVWTSSRLHAAGRLHFLDTQSGSFVGESAVLAGLPMGWGSDGTFFFVENRESLWRGFIQRSLYYAVGWLGGTAPAGRLSRGYNTRLVQFTPGAGDRRTPFGPGVVVTTRQLTPDRLVLVRIYGGAGHIVEVDAPDGSFRELASAPVETAAVISGSTYIPGLGDDSSGADVVLAFSNEPMPLRYWSLGVPFEELKPDRPRPENRSWWPVLTLGGTIYSARSAFLEAVAERFGRPTGRDGVELSGSFFASALAADLHWVHYLVHEPEAMTGNLWSRAPGKSTWSLVAEDVLRSEDAPRDMVLNPTHGLALFARQSPAGPLVQLHDGRSGDLHTLETDPALTSIWTRLRRLQGELFLVRWGGETDIELFERTALYDAQSGRLQELENPSRLVLFADTDGAMILADRPFSLGHYSFSDDPHLWSVDPNGETRQIWPVQP